MPFALDSNPSPGEISEAINYLLANLLPGLTVNQQTGQIIAPGGNTVSYLYKYLAVKYADNFDGTVGFSNTPTNKSYYGLRNTDSSVESTNPADYVWYQVAGGFGTTKFLFYLTSGGRAIEIYVGTTAPSQYYLQDNGSSIDLDFVTTAPTSPANFAVIRTANDFTPPTNSEVLSAIGRLPINGDLCIVNYNSGAGSIQYKYSGSWTIFQKILTGQLVVDGSITAQNMQVGTITAASGIIANAAILSANIGTAEVQTLNIAGQAVTVPFSLMGNTKNSFGAPSAFKADVPGLNSTNPIFAFVVCPGSPSATTTATYEQLWMKIGPLSGVMTYDVVSFQQVVNLRPPNISAAYSGLINPANFNVDGTVSFEVISTSSQSAVLYIIQTKR
jgi:hypothetical protein